MLNCALLFFCLYQYKLCQFVIKVGENSYICKVYAKIGCV